MDYESTALTTELQGKAWAKVQIILLEVQTLADVLNVSARDANCDFVAESKVCRTHSSAKGSSSNTQWSLGIGL